MRLFHFLNLEYGLDDIRRRRLKISLIPDLNDPFELLSIELSNRDLRQALRATIEGISKNGGILCFSKGWSNPVQWSHYADRRRGLCLGFEVPDALLLPVSYTTGRLISEANQLLTTNCAANEDNEAAILKLLSTKYAHWKYENEVRCFVRLLDKDPENGLYFVDSSNDLRLVQIIVGARSDVSRTEVAAALGHHGNAVRVFKARLAFRSFKLFEIGLISLGLGQAAQRRRRKATAGQGDAKADPSAVRYGWEGICFEAGSARWLCLTNETANTTLGTCNKCGEQRELVFAGGVCGSCSGALDERLAASRATHLRLRRQLPQHISPGNYAGKDFSARISWRGRA